MDKLSVDMNGQEVNVGQFALDIGATPLTSGVHLRVWAPAVIVTRNSNGIMYRLEIEASAFALRTKLFLLILDLIMQK